MTRSRRLALALACAAAAACAEEAREAVPRIHSVSPGAGYRSAETAITVRGEGFRAEPYQTAQGTPAVDATFRVWLGATELAGVAWVSERELRARVPAGLAAGAHRLELRDPRGATAALDDAYAVVAATPPALAVTAAVAPAVASLGQPVTLRVEVANGGETAALGVVPAVTIAGDALALAPDPPAPLDVPPGEARTFYLAGTAAAQGTAAVMAGAAGTDPVTGGAVAAPEVSAGSLLVQPPSLLTATARVTPERASVGQLIAIEVTYANAPQAAAVAGLQPAISAVVGAGAVAPVALPPPCDVPGGGTCAATFLVRAEVAGEVEVQVDAVGADANSGAPVPAPRASAPLVLDAGPSLSAVATATPARVSVGQVVLVTVAVTNAGDVAALGVAISVRASPEGAEEGTAPLPQDVPAGETRTFSWEFVARSPGTGAFVAAAAGQDANGAGAVSSGSVLSNDVVVEEPASLVATAQVAPAQVSAGQPLALTLDVTNVGGAPADATPALAATASGSAGWSAAEPPAARIAGGETVRFAWTVATAGSGVLTLAPRVDAVDANSGAPLSAGAIAGPVVVQAPAGLAAAIEAPAVVNAGRTFTVAVVLSNPGEAAASDASADVSAAGPATRAGGPVPGTPLRIEGGASARIEWTYVSGAAPGTILLDATAGGADENAGTPLAAAAAQRAVPVQRPAALAVELLSPPARVNAGQRFVVRVRVRNDGDASALGVAAAIACDGCSAEAPPAAVDLGPGDSRELERTLVAGTPGESAVRAGAAGADGTDGGACAATEVAQPLSVEHPAALGAAFRAPPVAPAMGFVVELEVTNPVADPAHAQADAVGVTPGALAVVEGTGLLLPAEVTCAPLDQGPADVVAGAAAVFRWTCSATRVGEVRLASSAAGSDGNDGAPLAASAAATYVLDEAAEVLADPFGDGAAFSFVFGYDGHVFLGPSGDGRGVVRCAPDGSGCASFAFSFAYDTTAVVPPGIQTGTSRNVPPNGCAAPVTTLGAVGHCDAETPTATPCSCGPDFESGRGLFTSVRLGAAQDEWLVAMGRTMKMGELNYAYMTRSTASPLAFSYADLYVAMPPEARVENVIATAVLNDRLYLGLQVETTDRWQDDDESTDGPRLAVLTRPPDPPGLDATAADAFAITFQRTPLGENPSAPVIAQVDAVLGFEGRLFVANRRAVLVSRTGAPPAGRAGAEFDDCTPLAPAEWEASGIAHYPAKVDITPADKGVSGLAAWAGRLYLARNTRAGPPELWAFTPRHDGGGAFLGCAADRSDWRRVATSFGAATRTRATALFASERFLYYGMDDPTAGLALFRSSSPAPQAEADFSGRQGCAAPCTPVGQAGFGDPANRRFFDARAITFGEADQVWATVGDGAGAVRVYRVAEE